MLVQILLFSPSAAEPDGLVAFHVGPHHQSGEERRVHGASAAARPRPRGPHQAHQPHGRQQGPAHRPAAGLPDPAAEHGGEQHDCRYATSGKTHPSSSGSAREEAAAVFMWWFFNIV